jgi:hypothetical protein
MVALGPIPPGPIEARDKATPPKALEAPRDWGLGEAVGGIKRLIFIFKSDNIKCFLEYI